MSALYIAGTTVCVCVYIYIYIYIKSLPQVGLFQEKIQMNEGMVHYYLNLTAGVLELN